jgi:hypothetical protein
VAKDSDHKAGALDAERTGLLTGLFAEENEFDRRALWRIGTWGFAAVGALVLAVSSNQWSMGQKRDQIASADLSRQAQQIQVLTKESQNEARRLANAVDTLNSDRDRLFSRITVLEQGLDSVTGTVAKQAATGAAPKPPPSVAPPPATLMPPSAAPADNQPQPAAPAPPPQAAAPPVVPPVTTATAPERPRADAAKPDAAASALPQIASNKQPTPPGGIAPGGLAPGGLAAAVPLASPLPANAPPALGAQKSMMGPPDPAAPKLVEPARTATLAPPPAAPVRAPTATAELSAKAGPKERDKDQEKAPADTDDADAARIQRTEFAVELGGANSIGGLRALWRGLLKSNNAELAELRPIIVLREGTTGLGMQLRLAAGPLPNAADAARICASLTESKRACETTVFDGQKLTVAADEQVLPNGKPAPGAKPLNSGRRSNQKHSKRDEPLPPPATPAPKQESSTFSSLFSGSKR